MNLKQMISGLKKGQKVLNDAKVMPLGILINDEKWHYYKYKALPGHSNPGNAGKGFSHPQPPKGIDYSEILKTTRSPRDEYINIVDPKWTDSEAWEKLVAPIIKAIGWDAKGTTAYYSRRTETGELESIDIARGGIIVWEDYPSDMSDVGTDKEQKRIGKIRKEEKEKTDEYVHAYLSKIGKKGGSVSSEKKTVAVRENAKLGGWPKGRPRKKKTDTQD